MIANFLNSLSGMSKAVIGTGLISGAAIITVLNAIVASFGIGLMPEMTVLQDAVVSVLYGILGGFFIWLVPNFQVIKPKPEIEENIEN